MKLFIRIFCLFALCLFVVGSAFAQVVTIDTTNNIVDLPPIKLPQDGNIAWLYSKEGMSAIIGLLVVITQYIATLFPGFRKLKLDTPLKAIVIGIAVTAVFATVKGMPLVPTLISLIFGSVGFWSQSIYSIIGKPALGSSTEVAAAVAKSAVEDPTVPYPEPYATELPTDEKKN